MPGGNTGVLLLAAGGPATLGSIAPILGTIIDDIVVFAVIDCVADIVIAAAAGFVAVDVVDVDVDVTDVIDDVDDVIVAETDGTLLEYVTEPAALITLIVGVAPMAPEGPLAGITVTVLPCGTVRGTLLPAGVSSGLP